MQAKCVVEANSCTGCRTCEIACSYHHRRVFQPSIASIEIGEIKDKLKCDITFYTENANGHLACDRCKGEDQPLCIKYCNAVEKDELVDIWQKCFST